MASFVILTWAATGQICDKNGVRLAGEPYLHHEFPTAADAHDFCNAILLKLPFLECHISGDVNTTLHSEYYVGPSFVIAATGRYCVRLFEWVSKALVSETGAYLSATNSEPNLQFETYRQAHLYCKGIMKATKNVEPWIYGRDGVVMQRGGSEVALHESGEFTVNIPWWRSFNRK